MYIHKCIHYNYLVLHSAAHIKQEHILTESEQDSSNKHTTCKWNWQSTVLLYVSITETCIKIHCHLKQKTMNETSKWKTKLSKRSVIKLRVQKLVLHSICHWLYFKLQLQIQGVSKRALQLWKLIEIYTEDIQFFKNCEMTKKDAFTSSKMVHPLITLEKCASISTPVSQVGG